MSTTSLTSSHTSSFRFLDLPPELRLYIYRFVFEDYHEWRKTTHEAYTDKHVGVCTLSRIFGETNTHEIYITIPSGPDKLCFIHRNHSMPSQYHVPPLLHLSRSVIGLEATSLYFSTYKLTLAVFWKTHTTGGFRALTCIWKKWNLSDYGVIRHLTLEFQGENARWSNRGRLDNFDILVAWAHFFASRDPAVLPKPSAIHCKWIGMTHHSPWSKTNTLESTWPKLLAGLETLGRQIRVEYRMQGSHLHRPQPHVNAVKKLVRSWINEWQVQDDFINAKKDLLRSWAAVAKFTRDDGSWIFQPASFQNEDAHAWSQEKWDLYLGMPWSKEPELEN